MIVTRSEVAAGTAIPNFADVPLAHGSDGTPPTPAAAADRIAAAASAHGYSPDQLDWVTPEGIVVKPLYTGADRDSEKWTSTPGSPSASTPSSFPA